MAVHCSVKYWGKYCIHQQYLLGFACSLNKTVFQGNVLFVVFEILSSDLSSWAQNVMQQNHQRNTQKEYLQQIQHISKNVFDIGPACRSCQLHTRNSKALTRFLKFLKAESCFKSKRCIYDLACMQSAQVGFQCLHKKHWQHMLLYTRWIHVFAVEAIKPLLFYPQYSLIIRSHTYIITYVDN